MANFDQGDGYEILSRLRETRESFCFINVVLQLSHLPTKETTVEQRVPDEDTNVVDRAVDGLVGYYIFLCFYINLLCFVRYLYVNNM